MYIKLLCFIYMGIFYSLLFLSRLPFFASGGGPVKIYAQNCLQAPAE